MSFQIIITLFLNAINLLIWRYAIEALYKVKRAYVSEISKTVKQPKPIEDLFSKHYLNLIWYDDTLKILVSSINPNSDRNIKLGLQDILKDNYGERDKLSNIGYFFNTTNGRIISKKKFNSQHTIQTD